MARVSLHPLDTRALALASADPAAYAAREGLTLGSVGETVREVARQTAAFVAAQGIPAGWGGFLASDEATRTVVGTCAFKGPPDETGAVEIAYFTFPSHEGRGYGSAMAEALVERAGSNPEVSVVRAHTLPERNSSGRILRKLGFAFVGIVQLPEDGAVWRWERPVSPGA